MNLCNSFPTASFKTFADDTAILITGKFLVEAADNMNVVLSKVNIWFKLNLNPSKTWYMIFNENTEQEKLIHIDNEYTERVW